VEVDHGRLCARASRRGSLDHPSPLGMAAAATVRCDS
jgi:hypothetical protein